MSITTTTCDQEIPIIESKHKNKKVRKIRQAWTPDETKHYLQLVAIHNQNWRIISSLLPNRTYAQCKEKWRTANPSLNNGKMSDDEIILLINLVIKHKTNWILIFKAFNKKSRMFLRSVWLRYIKKLKKKQINLDDVVSVLSLECPYRY